MAKKCCFTYVRAEACNEKYFLTQKMTSLLSGACALRHTLCSILSYAAAGRKILHSGIYSVLVVSLWRILCPGRLWSHCFRWLS